MPIASVNGTTLAFDDAGNPDGIPLVFSHSLFFNRTMFRGLMELLAADHRLISYDHRGQGESAPASPAELSMDRLAEDAAALIEHLGAGPVHFLGNSMGGFVALRLAARRPELVRSAVALGSSAEEEHRLAEFQPLIDHLREHGARDVIDTLMHIMFGDFSLTDPSREAMCQEWRAYMSALPAAIGDAANAVIHRTRVAEEIGRTDVPILAIAGAEDHAYAPPLSSEVLAGHARNGRHVTVPNAGHSVALEDPETVAEILRTHFAAVDRP